MPQKSDEARTEITSKDDEVWERAMSTGDGAFRSGDHKAAVYHYLLAANAKPDVAAPFIRIGQVHEQANRPDAAEQAYRMALAREPKSILAQEGVGVSLIRQGKTSEALEQLTAVAARASDRWRTQNGLGVLADMRGDFAAARTHYESALKADGGDNPKVLNNYGYSFYLSHDWESAARIFTQAVEKNPSYWPAWNNLGLVRVRQGRYNEAQTIFRKFMAEHEALNTLGYLCTLTGDYENARKFLNQAVAQSPTYYKDAYDNLEYLRYKM